MSKNYHLAGTLLSIGAAVFYTATHVCLRYVASDTEPAMTCAIRGLVAAVAVLPWFIWRIKVGRWPLPPLRLMLLLICGFAFVQLGGNLCIQYAMAGVGLAIAVPVVYGTQLIASAILGRLLLGERVPALSLLAIGITTTSVMILSTGMESHAEVPVEIGSGGISYLLGFLAACMTGLAYTAMALIMRATVSRKTEQSNPIDPLTIVFVNAMVGVIIMTPLTVGKIGIEGILNIEPDQLMAMFGVGLCNLAALFCYSSAMKFIKVVHANVINASQIAGCYLAGVILFSEIISIKLLFGVALTIIGVLFVGVKPRRKTTLPKPTE